ncbi:MAG: TolC family protein, partial [Candidatus Kapaibacterium sp.]
MTKRRCLFMVMRLVFAWTFFPASAQDALSVREAVRQALRKNYDIIIAADDAEAARRGDTWAAAGAFPTAGAGASVTTARVAIDQQFSSGTTARQRGVEQTNLQAYAHLQWRVFDGMRMFATKERLAEIRERGESALRQQVAQSVADVMMLYYALVRTDKQMDVVRSQLQAVLERKSVADVRESAGLAARTDVLQARMDVNDVQAQLMDLRTKRRKDELALQTVMGMDTTGSIRCADDIRVDTSLDVQRLRRRLLGANERVLQSMIDLRIARLQKREAAAAGLPGLDLQAGYMFNRSRNSAGFALFNENNGFSAGANLVVPLFNGLRTDAELEQRQLEILKKEHS